MQSSALILFGHGSRDPQWRRPIEAVAERLRTRHPARAVRCAYLELTEPDLPATVAALVAEGIQAICVVPMFLGVGRHAREDLPALVNALRTQYPNTSLELRPAVGEDERLLEMLADIAEE